jgi:hypothetical protein
MNENFFWIIHNIVVQLPKDIVAREQLSRLLDVETNVASKLYVSSLQDVEAARALL